MPRRVTASREQIGREQIGREHLMPHEFTAALCLVLVLEGLFLFAAPRAWQHMAEQMRQIEPRRLRIIGGVMMVAGVLALKLVN
jgi:uncharacterized protein